LDKRLQINYSFFSKTGYCYTLLQKSHSNNLGFLTDDFLEAVSSAIILVGYLFTPLWDFLLILYKLELTYRNQEKSPSFVCA